MTLTYDVHAHCVPSAFRELLTSSRAADLGVELVRSPEGDRVRFAGGVTTPPMVGELHDLEHRLAAMDRARVDVQLLSSWIDLTAYGIAPSAGEVFARAFNEHLAAEVDRDPQRFRGLCLVPLQAPSAAARELRHAVTELGMVGVEIATTVAGVDLDDPELGEFWATAEDLRCLVLIHPYQPLAGRDLGRYFLDNIIARPAESTIALAYLVFGGVLDAHPDLRPVFVHGGGFAPWQSGRWSRAFETSRHLVGSRITTHPRELLARVHFDTVMHDPTMLRALVDWAGPERVVLGSDHPFPMGDPLPVDSLDALDGLTAADRALVAGGNVERLLADVRR